MAIGCLLMIFMSQRVDALSAPSAAHSKGIQLKKLDFHKHLH